MNKIVIRTEAWNTRKGTVVKAVARDERGILLGATNQTKNLTLSDFIVGSK